jgi:hypothetical protein
MSMSVLGGGEMILVEWSLDGERVGGYQGRRR